MKKIIYYECPQCGTEHELKTEAKQCCPLEFEKRIVYRCDCCDEEHDTKKEAKECCDDDELEE